MAVDHRWRDDDRGGGGPFTGYGFDLLIIDDPVKNREEANSPTQRQHLWDWWRSTARTRLEPGGSMIIVMTRWHEDDLVGRLLGDEYTEKQVVGNHRNLGAGRR